MNRTGRLAVAAGLLAGFWLAACSDGSGAAGPAGGPGGGLTVFAAASLTDAFAAIADAFESEHPGVSVALHFASSSALRAQIEEGAPADVFASADAAQMDLAVRDGRVEGAPRIFAATRLVVVVPEDNPAGVESVADLARAGVKLVLAGEDVPIGSYAREVVDNLARDPSLGPQYREAVLANVVSHEPNARLVLAKVELGEADAAFVYASDALSAGEGVRTVEIPEEANVRAEYPVAVTAGASNPEAAAAFIDFVLSPAGQEVLREHGFAAPG